MGGKGWDTASYYVSDTGVSVNLATGEASGGHAEGDTLRNVENVFGSRWNDTLVGDEGDNQLDGFLGDDVLAGGDGADRLVGGVEGGTFFGQGGADVFVVAGGTSWVMDFAPGGDRFEISGMTEKHFRAAATQDGDHLHVAFDGGDLYLAWTTLGALEGVDLLV